jgi:hypothetical protein
VLAPMNIELRVLGIKVTPTLRRLGVANSTNRTLIQLLKSGGSARRNELFLRTEKLIHG